ncbi:MAG: type II toxin-antitoxin system YoeB family toxin [Treponema sp.]
MRFELISASLKENLSGYWSRTIDEKNRLVYKIEDGLIKIIQCKNHFPKI